MCDSLRFQSKAKFTKWSKEATKVGLCSVPPAGHTASLLCLLNSSSMSSMLKDVVDRFDRLYKKKVCSLPQSIPNLYTWLWWKFRQDFTVPWGAGIIIEDNIFLKSDHK